MVEGFPRLYERANEKLSAARANLQPEPLFIRPSVQWYAGIERMEITEKLKPELSEAEKDEFGIWHVCYSMHSSRQELESALQFLRPKWVISTTPPCRAMELNYVKKHCFKTQMTADDPLWKLLKLSPRKPISIPSSTAPKNPRDSDTSSENRLEPENSSTEHFELKLDLVVPCRARPITLFGRARLSAYYEEPDISLQAVKKPEFITSKDTDEVQSLQQRSKKTEESDVIKQDDMSGAAEPSENFSKSFKGSDKVQRLQQRSEKSEECDGFKKDASCARSSKSFSQSLKKLYRSMNVPVPKPLPSLVDLMNVSKRARIESASILHRISNCSHSLEYSSS